MLDSKTSLLFCLPHSKNSMFGCLKVSFCYGIYILSLQLVMQLKNFGSLSGKGIGTEILKKVSQVGRHFHLFWYSLCTFGMQ